MYSESLSDSFALILLILVLFQTDLNSTSSELQQLKDMSTHQRKRINEMLSNLLKDLGEIGVAIGGDGDMKVYSFLDMCCSMFS